jgi:hypothetical protein
MALGQRRFISIKSLWKPAAVALATGVLLVGAAGRAGAADDEKAADKAEGKDKVQQLTFTKDVQPLMKESCMKCHGAPNSAGAPPRAPGGGQGPGRGPGGPGGPGGPRGPAGGLRLDSKAAILKGGKHGKAVVPGMADESLLYKVLKDDVTVGNDEIHAMPKARQGQDFKPLDEKKVELIKKWIDQGAK